MNFEAMPYPRFWRWLEYFCKDCRDGKSINELIKVHLNFNFDELFSIDQPRFLNKLMLKSWCEQKKKEGHDPEAVDEYSIC